MFYALMNFGLIAMVGVSGVLYSNAMDELCPASDEASGT